MSRRKTIFIRSLHGKPNMRRFYAYYLNYLADYHREKVNIIYYDKIFHGRYSLARFIDKIGQFLQRYRPYDLIISDYYSPIVFKQAITKIFVTHGAIYKHNPHKKAVQDKKALNYFREKRQLVDYIITIGKNDANYYLRHEKLEDLPLPKYLSLGLPRNDILFDESFVKQSKSYLKQKYQLTTDRFLLWAPTYRPYDLQGILPFGLNDFMQLNQFLKEKNWILLYRPHYFKGIFDERWLTDLSNILLVDAKKESNTQLIMAAADQLVTDFSSIFVDYLILNRPIAFFQFDESKYHETNGYHLDFHNSEFIPGPLLNKLSDFCDLIDAFESNTDPYEARRQQSIDFFYSHFDNLSSARIWDVILHDILKLN